MKKNFADNLKAMLILIILIVALGQITRLPWWSFVIPVIVLGLVLTVSHWKVSYFLTGFLSGALSWTCAYLYFHLTYEAPFFNRHQYDIPLPIMILVPCLVGGLLTGLAFYTGHSAIVRKRQHLSAMISKEEIE
jgi:hypothetical protein